MTDATNDLDALVGQQALVDVVIERAEQACRYVYKHNEDNMERGPYQEGFETACEVCEGAIRANVMRHIASDLAALRNQEHLKDD